MPEHTELYMFLDYEILALHDHTVCTYQQHHEQTICTQIVVIVVITHTQVAILDVMQGS